MPINKLTSPQSTPTSLADWVAMKNLIESVYLGTELPVRIDYDNDLVLKGSVFQIGGSIYLADADTAITGTPSDYVKLTPSGSIAAPSYVANLTGITWNDTYNGYYDGSGNLVVFDEMKARLDAVVSTVNSSPGNYANNIISGLDGFVREMKVSAIGTRQSSLTPGGWYQVNIGNTNYNLIPGASLASNILTLPAGRFLIKGFCNLLILNYGCCRLYNISDAAPIDYGSVCGTEDAALNIGKSNISSYLTLASPKNIRLEYYYQTGTGYIGNNLVAVGSAENVALHIQQINRD